MPRLSLLVIRSADIHRSAGFYRQIGLVPSPQRHGDGPEHYAAVLDGLVFEIYPLGPGRPPTTSVRLGFVVASVDDVTEKLVRIGATVVTPPHDADGERRAVVKDFDGHTIELLQTP